MQPWDIVSRREAPFHSAILPDPRITGEGPSSIHERHKRLINISNWMNCDTQTDVLLPECLMVPPKTLRSHQLDAVRFLWARVVEGPNHGAIIAHAMGLGKTATTVTFLSLFSLYRPAGRAKCVVLAPKSTLHAWCQEMSTWGFLEPSVFPTYLLDDAATREKTVQCWNESGGVLVMGHHGLRCLEGSCLDIVYGADVVVCDEGHVLRNCESQLSLRMKKFKSCRRIVLTGTPLQNHLSEYWCLIDWVYPGAYDKDSFIQEYEVPIERSLRQHAVESERISARTAVQRLIAMLATFVHRRDVTILTKELPPLHEFMVYLRLTDSQREQYNTFCTSSVHSKGDLFSWFTTVTHICNVGTPKPAVILPPKPKKKRTRDDEEDAAVVEGEVANANEDELLEGGDEEVFIAEEKQPAEEYNGVKLQFILEMLEMCLKMKEKLLVFSKSRVMLRAIRIMVETMYEKKIPVLQLDGSTNTVTRALLVQSFQSDSELKFPIFLLSTKAGGLGLTLTAATRVVIADILWNPMDDQQAVFRAYRYTQTRPVYIYRLVTRNTLEDRVHQQKISKEWMARRVVDNHVALRDCLTGMRISRSKTLLPQVVNPTEEEKQFTTRCVERDDLLREVVQWIPNAIVFAKDFTSIWREDPDSNWERDVVIDPNRIQSAPIITKLTVEQINEKLRMNLLSLDHRRSEGSSVNTHAIVRSMNLPTNTMRISQHDQLLRRRIPRAFSHVVERSAGNVLRPTAPNSTSTSSRVNPTQPVVNGSSGSVDDPIEL